MKKAFTLSELLVCIVVIGALVTICISTISSKPNANMVLFRKAYNIVSNTVYEMTQDEDYYPAGTFDNTNSVTIKGTSTTASGDEKFCKLFASYLNISENEPTCVPDWGKTSFTTMDGITWKIPSNNATFKTIYIDVNGPERPNCQQNPGYESYCPNPDQFDISVDKYGKLTVYNETAKRYLQNKSNIRKK